MRNFCTKAAACLLALLLALGLLPVTVSAAAGDYVSQATLTFSDSGIAETVPGSGYAISGTTLTISKSGVYTVTGTCAEGNVVVKKGTTGVVLILRDLDLRCSATAPLACNKTTEVTLLVSGAVVLTDGEDPANETSADTALADAFEGAAIKVKSGAALTIAGDGALTADGSACKNGIKGAATARVTVDMEGTLTVLAANNGLASDGEVLIKNGTLNVTAGNEGVKSDPDADDTDSAGRIAVSGGQLTVSAGQDGLQAAKEILISGGSFHITAQRDGIQSNGDLTITGGTFTVKTLNGYQSSGFSSSTMSCKGLKAASGDSAVENAANKLYITGGTFYLNTADDAIHSDGTIEIYGGTFEIYTGDDGIHADTSLTLGSADGLDRDPDIRINSSYEGLESGNLYIAGGRYYVCATDDGINAAGGSSSDDHFNPGGGPGGGWGGWGGRPGGGQSTGDYSLNVSGGLIYVNCNGDGLDSNGDLNLTGGRIEIWSQSSGDNEPLDSDGTLYVNGATVFAAGCTGMGQARPGSGSQTYKNFTTRISSGSVVQVKDGGVLVYSAAAPKAVSYEFYSSPDLTGSVTLSTGGSVTCAAGSSWTHTWDGGNVTLAPTTEASGVLTFTCSVCGATETQTIPALAAEDPGEDPSDEPDAGYPVTFTADAGSTLAVYATQDVTGTALVTVASGSSGTDVSRNGNTGAPDSTGDGQVNFTVTVRQGYTLTEVAVTEGTYKNLKLISSDPETGVYVYRVTKITGQTAVTVTTQADQTEDPKEDPVTLPFTDVKEDAYYYSAVVWALAQGVTSGTSETTFSPLAGCTRAQVVSFLWRAAGKPEPALTECGFTDVDQSAYYYKPVLWAVEQGITAGTSETRFSPAATCTRAQIVSFLYRYAGSPAVAAADNPFTDVKENAYYYSAVLWALENRVTAGTSETKFSPGATCTRAQVVSFLYRYLDR